MRTIGAATAAAIGLTNLCHAQDTATHILMSVRNQVVALRVTGDTPDEKPFRDGGPPLWGTGFVVGPLASVIDGKQRIITAAHVVKKDELWAKKGGRPARLVYPTVLGRAGSMLVEPFLGVSVNSTSDIAQVHGPRGMTPATIEYAPFKANETYYVVSWGYDSIWERPSEEPYLKKVKVATPLPGDPPLGQGLTLLRITPGQSAKSFKGSESGSPVYNSAGHAVGIMIREWKDTRTGVAARGVALPFVKVAAWLEGVRKNPIAEPKKLILSNLISKSSLIAVADEPDNKRPTFDGSCIFLGKYSARNLKSGNPHAKSNAPLGTTYLRKVIDLFPSANPSGVSDKDAVVTRQLREVETLSIPQGNGINIRTNCPEIVPKPGRNRSWERIAYYGASIAVADSRFRIRLKSIQRQAYLGDFFYWGQISSVSPR